MTKFVMSKYGTKDDLYNDMLSRIAELESYNATRTDELAAAARRIAELEAENSGLLRDLNTAYQQIKTEQRLSFRDQVAVLEQQRDELLAAAENLIKVKGRHHTETAYRALEAAIARVKQ